MPRLIYAIIILSSVFLSSPLRAQELWDWNKCLEQALSANIQLKLNDINVALADLQLRQSKLAFTPAINANSGFNINFGRTIDPTTYSFVTKPVQTGNLQLNLNQPLFEGMRNIHTRNKSLLDLEAARLYHQNLKEDISLQVMNAYLNVLNATELLAQAKDQLQRSKGQYDINKNLVEAGALPERNLVDIEAQLAADEYNIAFYVQQKELALLALKAILQVPADSNIDLVAPPVETFSEIVSLTAPTEIYQKALSIRPDVKSFRLKINSAEKGIKIAKSGYYPSIRFYSAAQTNYSDQFSERTIGASVLTPIGIVESTGQSVVTLVPQQIISDVPFIRQMDKNLTFATGISMTIPIYNKRAVYFSTEQSRLSLAQAQLNSENIEFTLFNNIKEAHTKAVASAENFIAAGKNLKAAKASLDYAQERAASGAISQLEVNLASSNYFIALSRLTQARFDYIFNIKVLDYYEGKSINFD
jgi:outer membrane protein